MEFQDSEQIIKLRREIFNMYDLGYSRKKEKTNYHGYDYYRKIFHFTIVMTNNIYGLFSSKSNKGHVHYNRLLLPVNGSVKEEAEFISEYLKRVSTTTCFVVDNRHLTDEYMWHETLFIYRPDINQLEHYDPNGAALFGDRGIFETFVGIILNDNPGMNFLPSVVIQSFEHDDIFTIKLKSLNTLCSLTRSEDSEDGWCQIWSLIIYDLVTRYDMLSTKEIIKTIYEFLKTDGNGGRVKIKDAAFKALFIIRGYFYSFIELTNDCIDNKSLEIDAGILDGFNLDYIVTDVKLYDFIDSELDKRLLRCPKQLLDSEWLDLMEEYERMRADSSLNTNSTDEIENNDINDVNVENRIATKYS
jgi:hypothetical protein